MKITKVMTPENAFAVRAEVRSVLSSPEPPEAVLVSVQSGVYAPEAFCFAAEDCSAVTHVAYRAEPGAIIHGGITVGREAWRTPDADMLARIPAEARPHVRMIPLTAYGLTREDWVSRYPRLARVVVDTGADPDHADAFFNPSYSSVRNNIAIEAGKLYEVGDAVYRFSDVTDNVLYTAASEAGWDEEAGNLSSDSPVFRELPGFRAIPAENIGIFR